MNKQSVALICGLSWCLMGAVEPWLYRDRGDRHEGVKSKPVSGYDIELVGALVETGGPGGAWPEKASLAFFLERHSNVFITIRERRPENYYWLDKVQPERPWVPKVTNVFTWPSGEVLRPLGVQPDDLVFLARLDRELPSRQEAVVPVRLGSAGGSQVGRYRFTFKSNAVAKVGWSVFGPGDGGAVLAKEAPSRYSADRLFDIRWDAGDKPEGRYRLLLKGYFLNDNAKIELIVDFYHAPVWPR